MEYKDLDFIEIGTSKFNSIIQVCDDDAIGISIEPILEYLNQLPDKKNVIKVNVAITGDVVDNPTIKIYYIPEETIINQKLHFFFLGCNKIGNYHPLHIKYNLTNLVKINDVKIINIGDFLSANKIRKIKYLQMDTEGHDTNIMIGLCKYLYHLPDDFHPNEIKWETNIGNCTKEQTDFVINLYSELNYVVTYRNDDADTIIKKQ